MAGNGAGSGAGRREREYGSHGSLDVMGRENMLAMFPPNQDCGPVAVSTLTRQPHQNLNRSEESAGSVVSAGSQDHTDTIDTGAASPKQKKKAIGGFWGNNKDKNNRKSQKSLFKKRTKDGASEGGVSNKSVDSDILDNRAEDKHRRRFFSHHDIGSVCASLSVTAQLRTLQRRNTTTGASAASAALRNSGGAETDSEEADQGDGVNNELVLR